MEPSADTTSEGQRARSGHSNLIRGRAADQGVRVSQWVQIRFRTLALAAGICLVAIFFLFQALFNQKVLIERQSRVNIWFLAQIEIEYLNFADALDLFALGDKRITKESLIDRFEIFWSRLPLLLTGDPTKQLRSVEGFVETASTLMKQMEKLEPALARIRREDTKELGDIRRTVAMLHEPIRGMVSNALLADSTTLTTERQSHEEIYDQLLALFLAIFAAGMILFYLLQRQILRTQKLVVHARDAEQSAESARSELVLAIESISEGFIIYDREDRVALFNERYREMHPSTAEVITVGAPFEKLLRASASRGDVKVATEEREAWIEECLRSHLAPEHALESELSDGRYLKISERKTIDGRIVGVHTDVTALKEHEIELTQKTTLLQTTFDSIDQGIALFDADLKLQMYNQLFVTMHGLPPHLVEPGRPYSEIVDYEAQRGEYGEGSAAQHVEQQIRVLDDLRHSHGRQKRIERRRPNGMVIETRYLGLPDGSFVKIVSDITERIRAEEERGRLREQFHASQKMQAIGTLAGGIAHDFNNILGSILGNCFLLLEDMPEKDAIHERLLQIQKASNRAKALVQQILTYSRHAEFALTPLAVDEAVKDSVALIRSSLPPTVDLVCEEFETAYVAADVTQLHQVVLNLCVNASQAIGDQAGTITVSMSTLDTSGSNGLGAGITAVQSGWSQMWIGSLTPRRYCCIRVADTGCGMSRQTMARIFEPFFTTKEVGTGTGLGLAAVHGILRNHDAVVAVSSRVGIGTVFEIYLPLCDERVAAIPEPLAANKDANLAPFEGDERILLVDDDRALLDATTTALLRRGYDVVAFANAEEALASFRRAPGTWDIVVTDRSMPRLSGEQLAHEIRQLRPDIPIIMATGFGDAADEKRARQIGINEFIFKPISNIDLMVAIRRALTGPAQQ